MKGSGSRALIEIIRLLVVIAAACYGAHLKEPDAQNGAVGQLHDQLTDERGIGGILMESSSASLSRG